MSTKIRIPMGTTSLERADMTVTQTILALAPVVLLVVLIMVLLRVARDHPEQIAVWRNWGVILGGILLIADICGYIAQHH
jgi:hypothetical protein